MKKILINEQEYFIRDIPKQIFILAPQRSTSIIEDGFKKAGIKYPKMKPIKNISLLKNMITNSRIKKTINNVEKIWGLEIGKNYCLVCIDYKIMNNGFKPKILVLFMRRTLKKIAYAGSATRLVLEIKKKLKRKK